MPEVEFASRFDQIYNSGSGILIYSLAYDPQLPKLMALTDFPIE